MYILNIKNIVFSFENFSERDPEAKNGTQLKMDKYLF